MNSAAGSHTSLKIAAQACSCRICIALQLLL